MSELLLPPSTDSVRVARRFAQQELRASSADVETTVLLVSEAVTNAVLHARSDLRLSVEDLGTTVRVEVADSSPATLRIHRYGTDSATGRGLRLIDRLAQRWGIVPAPDGMGKTVWFVVGAPDDGAWESFGESLLAEATNGAPTPLWGAER